MVLKKTNSKNRRKLRKKYSLNERIAYHNKRVKSAFSKAKDSEARSKLFKKSKIAYSLGYTDGIDGSTQFSTIAEHGGDGRAYGAGVEAGIRASDKARTVKF